MDPHEVATKFSSHCNYCNGDKCPFASKCNGKRETCGLVEVAMLLRAQKAEIDSLSAAVAGLRDIIDMMNRYCKELEDINGRYRALVQAFQRGYKPQRKISHTKKKKPKVPRRKTLEQMDGDPRYEYNPDSENKPSEKMELVVI